MVDGIKKAIVGTGDGAKDFVKRGVFSSEFLLVVIYFVIVTLNAKLTLGLTEVEFADLRSFVYLWTGIRQVGKAVSYTPASKEDKS